MHEIIVDGQKYVRAAESGPIKIVVLERGFVFVGRVTNPLGCEQCCNHDVQIDSARSLIRWGTTQHLGELANGPMANTKLGAPCTVRVKQSQVIYQMEVSQDGWHNHVG